MAITKQKGRCLALVGGLGVGAAIHYYRELAKAHEQRWATMRLAMLHADMYRAVEHVQAGDPDGLAQYFAGLIGAMQAAGAEIAAIPAVTPHYCAPQLEAISPLPLVNILRATADAVLQKGLRRVAVFGTRFSIETDLFGQLRQVEIVRPSAAEIDFIHATYFQLAQSGTGTEAQRRDLSELAHRLIERERLDAILLAGTDFSVIFNPANTDFPHIDCAQAHIEAIMQRLLA